MCSLIQGEKGRFAKSFKTPFKTCKTVLVPISFLTFAYSQNKYRFLITVFLELPNPYFHF